MGSCDVIRDKVESSQTFSIRNILYGGRVEA